MRWLLPGSEITSEYEERAFLGGLTDALLSSSHGRVFLEMEENNSQVQERVAEAFPEANRVEGALAMLVETAPMRARATAYAMLANTFYELRDRWQTSTKYLSSGSLDHEAYLEIIKLGEPVVPLLLEEMRDRPSHWSAALMAITGENPIPKEHYGNLRLVAADWVRWGIEKGYLRPV